MDFLPKRGGSSSTMPGPAVPAAAILCIADGPARAQQSDGFQSSSGAGNIDNHAGASPPLRGFHVSKKDSRADSHEGSGRSGHDCPDGLWEWRAPGLLFWNGTPSFGLSSILVLNVGFGSNKPIAFGRRCHT